MTPGPDALSSAPFRAAVLQAAPVALDLEGTLQRVAELTARAAADGAAVAVFPEAFIGGYPKGIDFGVRLGTRDEAGRAAFERYHAAAIEVPGPAVERLGQIASQHRMELVIGVVERERGTLYCTALFLGPDGQLRGKHRKLVPTAMERCVWGRGDASTLTVVDSPRGKIGAAICWENYMPLMRAALFDRGTEVYCAPTVDDRDVWQSTMRHVAVEGRCHVLAACQHLRRGDLHPDLGGGGLPADEVLIRGGSVIIDPFGEVLAGPVYGEDAVLIAEIDPGAVVRGRFDLDVTGHYARPDVFELRVKDPTDVDAPRSHPT
ncbi:MAG: carbon-nitrogen hydrolase family protein [Planctomycetota bacterium]|nr:carbon-nitrogen hydrolase family protein [Planctomycetota bacterium]MDG1985391.1 carbon-nitrogen hydrolase family protein [Planctomycetota bacterium]